MSHPIPGTVLQPGDVAAFFVADTVEFAPIAETASRPPLIDHQRLTLQLAIARQTIAREEVTAEEAADPLRVLRGTLGKWPEPETLAERACWAAIGTALAYGTRLVVLLSAEPPMIRAARGPGTLREQVRRACLAAVDRALYAAEQIMGGRDA